MKKEFKIAGKSIFVVILMGIIAFLVISAFAANPQITVTTKPDTLVYAAGEPVDKTGMVVTLNNGDGTSRVLSESEYTISSPVYNSSSVTVTYTAGGLTAQLTGLTVGTPYEVKLLWGTPTDNFILRGSEFVAPGKVAYSELNIRQKSGFPASADSLKLAGYDALLYGSADSLIGQSVRVSFSDFSKTQMLKISQNLGTLSVPVADIEAVSPAETIPGSPYGGYRVELADNTYFYLHDTIRLYYKDSQDSWVAKNADELDFVMLTWGAGPYSVTFARNVSSGDILESPYEYLLITEAMALDTVDWTVPVESISVITPPAKTAYEAGESFDPSGMIIMVYFENETSAPLTGAAADITPSGPLAYGLSQVTVEFGGKTATVPITVDYPTEQMVLLATWTRNARHNQGSTAYRYADTANKISLLHLGDPVLFENAFQLTYTGGNIDSLVGLPVNVTFANTSRTAILSVSALGSSAVYRSGDIYKAADGNYRLRSDETIVPIDKGALETNYSKYGIIRPSAMSIATANLSGNYFFGSNGDEIITLTDTDGDGYYDHAYAETVFNAAEVIAVTATTVKLRYTYGSIYDTGWFNGNTSFNYTLAQGVSALQVGDYVNVRLILDNTSSTAAHALFPAWLVITSKSAAVSGRASGITYTSPTEIAITIGGVQYDWTNTIPLAPQSYSDGTNGVNAGRGLMTSVNVAAAFTCLLDESGKVVKALKTAEPQLNYIAVTTLPSKTAYFVGESFNASGMVVTAYYEGLPAIAVTGYTVTPSGTLGITDTYRTIGYGEKTVNLPISVSYPTEQRVLVATHTRNARNNLGSTMFITQSGYIAVADIGVTAGDVTGGAYSVKQYTGNTDINGLTGMPVLVTYNNVSKSEIISVTLLGASDSFFAGQLTRTGDKYFADGQEIEIDWALLNYTKEGGVYTRAFFKTIDGKWTHTIGTETDFFNIKSDERVTLIDTDEDGKYDWFSGYIVLGGVDALITSNKLYAADKSYGSASWTGWINSAGSALAFELEEGLTTGDILASGAYVNITNLSDAATGSIATGGVYGKWYVTLADTVTGALTAVTKGASNQYMSVSIDGVDYSWSSSWRPITSADGVDGADAGRTLMTEANIGKVYQFVLDEAGYIVRAVYKKQVSSIAITTAPAKTSYTENEELDLTGGVVTITYSDSSTAQLPMTDGRFSITGFNKYAQSLTVTVNYAGKSAAFTVSRPLSVPAGYVTQGAGNLMFGPSGGYIYNFAPSIIEAGGVRHVYYCTNTTAQVIVDSIAYRRGVNIDGTWYYSPESIVLYTDAIPAPTHGGAYDWDSLHNCDPSVIKGSFSYNSTTYAYLMAFLGCDNIYSKDNEIGLAVSDNPAGPWIKCDSINPILSSYRDMDNWGVGQPSLVSVDGGGEVMLFYASNPARGTVVTKWDFSDLNNPVLDESFIDGHIDRKLDQNIYSGSIGIKLPNTGFLRRDDGMPSNIYNAQFMYDKETSRLYMITERLPNVVSGEAPYPDIVGAVQTVLYYSVTGDIESILRSDTGEWITVCDITPTETGFDRNHNAAFVTDEYGNKPAGEIGVAITTNDAGTNSDNTIYLWDYRIRNYKLSELS